MLIMAGAVENQLRQVAAALIIPPLFRVGRRRELEVFPVPNPASAVLHEFPQSFSYDVLQNETRC